MLQANPVKVFILKINSKNNYLISKEYNNGLSSNNNNNNKIDNDDNHELPFLELGVYLFKYVVIKNVF